MRQHVGAAAARAARVGVGIAKALGCQVQRLVVTCQHHGQATAQGRVANVVSLLAAARGQHAAGGGQVGVAQHLAQQGQQQGVYRELVRRNVLAVALLHKVLPQVLRNLEGAGDFIAQLQAPGDAVVRFGLLCGLGGGEGGEAAELFSRNQPAFDADGGVGELLGVLACHVQTPVAAGTST